jgi:hypothetical protein
MLFDEIIPVYTENHAENLNTKCSVTDFSNGGYFSVLKG